jgi:hypothetical protein
MKNFDFRLMGEYQNGLLWYSVLMNLSVWQNQDIFCGWFGNIVNMPKVDDMFIGKSTSDIVRSAFSESDLKKIFR